MKKLLILVLIFCSIMSLCACLPDEPTATTQKATKQWCIDRVRLEKQFVQTDTITAEKQWTNYESQPDIDKDITDRMYWITVNNELHYTAIIRYKTKNRTIDEYLIFESDIIRITVIDGHKTTEQLINT